LKKKKSGIGSVSRFFVHIEYIQQNYRNKKVKTTIFGQIVGKTMHSNMIISRPCLSRYWSYQCFFFFSSFFFLFSTYFSCISSSYPLAIHVMRVQWITCVLFFFFAYRRYIGLNTSLFGEENFSTIFFITFFFTYTSTKCWT